VGGNDLALQIMNAFNLTIVIVAVGVMIAACVNGICSVLRDKREEHRSD
jgi:hypothetical protein